MLAITVRDLLFRWRQFAIAIVGAALVFSVALSLTGMTAGFKAEANATTSSLGAERWVVPAGVGGPFTSTALIDESVADQVRALPGVRRAEPVLTFRTSVSKDGTPANVMVVGYPPGAIKGPAITKGRAVQRAGEVVADSALHVGIGHQIVLGGKTLTVVGKTSGKTVLSGTPAIYLGIADVQNAVLGGRPVASSVITTGVPQSVPEGLRAITNADVEHDLLRPLKQAQATIANTRLMMWVVAGVIIGMVTYLAALDRVRDFAVLKAVGSPSRALAFSLSIEAVITSLLAGALAVVFAKLLRGIYSLPIVITATAYLALPVVALLVGLLASLAALRRTLRVDPALAFGG
ncbi:MAG: ABC transporter permease [Acidimicrobiales bacterium]